MSEVIKWEMRFFIEAIILGGILRAGYDLLLIGRTIKRAKHTRISIEDFFYWMICCYFVFGLLYENNNGVIRGFALCGIIIGMSIWHFGPSHMLIPILANQIGRIKKLIQKFQKFLGNILKKIMKYDRKH